MLRHRNNIAYNNVMVCGIMMIGVIGKYFFAYDHFSGLQRNAVRRFGNGISDASDVRKGAGRKAGNQGGRGKPR
jgi:hypothetical protein